MAMEHEVFVPFSAAAVRGALADAERVARCVPGMLPVPDGPADPAAPAGRLRVRIGGSTITYRGALALAERGEGLTVEGEGTEARGGGTVRLFLTVVPRPVEDGSGTTLAFNGSVAGKGRITEFSAEQREAAGRRLLDRFAEALADELARDGGAGGAGGAGGDASGIGGPDDNERAIPGIPAAPEPAEPAAEPAEAAAAEVEAELAGLEELGEVEEVVDEVDRAGRAGVPVPPEPEADFARRTMIGRSAEEVDHAPPRGRYAPEPAPGQAPAGPAAAALRWAAPVAAAAVASAVIVTRLLRRRRGAR
jgi:carbon monoxide dehydrogenase subunit G